MSSMGKDDTLLESMILADILSADSTVENLDDFEFDIPQTEETPSLEDILAQQDDIQDEFIDTALANDVQNSTFDDSSSYQDNTSSFDVLLGPSGTPNGGSSIRLDPELGSLSSSSVASNPIAVSNHLKHLTHNSAETVSIHSSGTKSRISDSSRRSQLLLKKGARVASKSNSIMR